MKRAVDVFISLVGLLVLSALLLLIAFLVRVKLGTPVLFRQTRPGLHGQPFVIYKFRTMVDAYDTEGKRLPDDERLTGLGKFLRSMSLDELPELINVLKGNMSIVGPRPLLMEYLSRYTSEQARRNEVKPGVTGWAQINGRNAITWDEKFRLDVWYVDNRSFLLDMKIIFMTTWKTLGRQDISHPGRATMEKFMGSECGKNG